MRFYLMLRRYVPLLAVGLCVVPLGTMTARAQTLDPDHPPREATPKEIKLGDEASHEFESAKTTKLLDPNSSPQAKATIDKLNAIVKKLGAASPRSGIAYTVKVVEDKDINAFTLPNGKIYVFRGLLDFVASDDELAGVLAHEIGHNTRLHALRGESKAKKLNLLSMAALAAALAGGTSGANVAQFSQYLLVGVMNGYGVNYEKEADSTAIDLMHKVGYNPAALVTFMDRLEGEEKRHPEVQLGIFQTHPPSDERAEAALAQMKAEGIPYEPRDVSGGVEIKVAEKPDRWSISIGDLVLIELAKDGPNAAARAKSAASRLQTLWKADLKAYEVSVTGGRLVARGQELAVANDADAKLGGGTVAGAANLWLQNFQRAFWREQLNGKV